MALIRRYAQALGGSGGRERDRGAGAECFPIPLVTESSRTWKGSTGCTQWRHSGAGIRITLELVKTQSTGSGGRGGGHCWQMFSHRLSEENKATKFVVFVNFCDRNPHTMADFIH